MTPWFDLACEIAAPCHAKGRAVLFGRDDLALAHVLRGLDMIDRGHRRR